MTPVLGAHDRLQTLRPYHEPKSTGMHQEFLTFVTQLKRGGMEVDEGR